MTARIVLSSLCAATFGCGYPQLPQPAPAPSHPPASEATWAGLEASARTSAERDGGELVASFRVTSRDVGAGSECALPNLSEPMCVEHSVPVAGNHCYTAGVAWPSAAGAHVDVMLAGVNDLIGRMPFVGSGGAASGTFCTDHAGAARLLIFAFDGSGVLTTHALLEYAVAVVGRPERPDETAARKQAETARVQAQLANERAEAVARAHRAAMDCGQCTRDEANCRASGRASLDCYMERRRCDDRIRDAGC